MKLPQPSIRFRLISAFVLMAFSIIVFFTFYIHVRETRSLRDEMVKRGLDVGKIFTQMAVPLLFTMDYIGILDNAKELVRDSDILSVTVADEEGYILVSTQEPRPPRFDMADPFYKKKPARGTQKHRDIRLGNGRAVEFVTFMSVFEKPAGLVSILISLKTLEKRISESLLSIGLLSACAMFLTLMLARMLSGLFEPIRVLVRGTREISGGNLEYRIPICSQDEIGQLTASFNEMAERVRSLVDSLEDQVRDRTSRLAEANQEIRQKNTHIMDSIRYAEKIQESMLPDTESVKAYLPDSFFLWMPRDLVGGDAYFVESFEDGILIALMDCTGHGIPGAFMSMIASSFIRKIAESEQCRDPAEILGRLNHNVKTSLRQDGENAVSDDGLDAGVCFVGRRSRGGTDLTFAGARLPLICVRNGEVSVIRGDRQSIGYRRSDLGFRFTNHTIAVEKGMVFYMASDGFEDQFGQDERSRFGVRSFGKKRFRNLIGNVAAMPFGKQRDALLRAFDEYRGECDIQDDVTVIGFALREPER